MQSETRYARSGEVNIAYQVVGEGNLDLVLVPGWVSNVEVAWEEPRHAYFLRRLASFSRLILFDRRGTGVSDRLAGIATMDERMDDIRAVMDAAGVQRAALFGYRGGGPISLLFAATHPGRTSSLVLFGSYARRTWAPDYPWGPTPEEHQVFLDRMEQAWGTDLHAPLLAPSATEDERFRQWWARYQRLSASPSAALAVARMNARIDLRSVLPAIRVPTLVLHRAGDREIDPGGSRYMADRIPGATYVELPGDDHLPWIGDADRVLDEIQGFLTGQRAAAAPDRLLLTILVADAGGTQEGAATGSHGNWAIRIAACREAILREVEQSHGVVRPSAGHVVLATFDGPGRAIACAQAIVHAARALGVETRVGIHTGECEIAGNEMGGVALKIAQWVAARAEPGTVLISSIVKDLVAGSGVEFEDMQAGLMEGETGVWRLYRLEGGAGDSIGRSTGATADGTAARSGTARISRRELEIAELVARGHSNRQIGEQLGIAIATVERHVANIMNKLGFHSRAQIASWAVEHGLLRDRQSPE